MFGEQIVLTLAPDINTFAGCIQLLGIIALLMGTLCHSAEAETFTNPVIFDDLADVMIIKVDDYFYYSASSMHFSPGAPILRSADLVNWEYISHSVPTLDFNNPAYNLTDGEQAYIRGVWASFFNYRPSDSTWIWGGCVDFWNTFIFTAPDVTGPWEKTVEFPGLCYYDSSLLIEDDETMYVSSGQSNITVAQLSDDFQTIVRSEIVWSSPDEIGELEFALKYASTFLIWRACVQVMLKVPGFTNTEAITISISFILPIRSVNTCSSRQIAHSVRTK